MTDGQRGQGALVLIASSVGSHGPVMVHDRLLAEALQERGARVALLLCDGVLPACEACTIFNIEPAELRDHGPARQHCRTCYQSGMRALRDRTFDVYGYSDFSDPGDRGRAEAIAGEVPDDEIRAFKYNGAPLGEEAYAGALRYFAVGDLGNEEMRGPVLRRFLQGALLAYFVVKRAMQVLQPVVACFHHGIYVPQGIIGIVAREEGVRVVNWALGYRKKTFVYSHGDTYHRTMIEEPVEAWQGKPLGDLQVTRLREYLGSRTTSKDDWIKFNEEPRENRNEIRTVLGLDARPIVLVLTNVAWDAQLYYQSNAFPSLFDWLEFTIRYFVTRADLQAVIRVHPGEARGTMPSRQPVMAEMVRRGVAFPDNVKVVEAASTLSTYALAEMSDCSIIYGTKTGVELSARGLPVIVAGEAWIRNKGLTIDVRSVEQYQQILDSLPLGATMPAWQRTMAEQYAYHYFFRRLIPLRALDYVQAQPPKLLKRLLWRVAGLSRARAFLIASPFVTAPGYRNLISAGEDPGLDVVCRGILEGTSFVYDD